MIIERKLFFVTTIFLEINFVIIEPIDVVNMDDLFLFRPDFFNRLRVDENDF